MIPRITSGLRRPISRLRERLRQGPVILLYHRVAARDSDPFGLCVSPGHFAEQMEVLATRFCPLPLGDLVDKMASGAAGRRHVAVTFDDGYRDNEEAALPVLERFAIPATFFVSSGQIGKDVGFWWDELERLVMLNGELPAEWTLEVLGRRFTFSSRDTAFRQLYALMYAMPAQEREKAMLGLRTACSPSCGSNASDHALTEGQLRRIAASPLMEVAAHSRNHVALPRLGGDERAFEIRRNREELESLTGKPVNGFAYPYGDYDEATVTAVSRLGFRYACTCEPARVCRGQDVMRLPRIEAGDWDGDAFRRAIAWSAARVH